MRSRLGGHMWCCSGRWRSRTRNNSQQYRGVILVKMKRICLNRAKRCWELWAKKHPLYAHVCNHEACVFGFALVCVFGFALVCVRGILVDMSWAYLICTSAVLCAWVYCPVCAGGLQQQCAGALVCAWVVCVCVYTKSAGCFKRILALVLLWLYFYRNILPLLMGVKLSHLTLSADVHSIK